MQARVSAIIEVPDELIESDYKDFSISFNIARRGVTYYKDDKINLASVTTELAPVGTHYTKPVARPTTKDDDTLIETPPGRDEIII